MTTALCGNLGDQFFTLVKVNFPRLTGYKMCFKNKKRINDLAYLEAQVAAIKDESLRMKLALCLDLVKN